jgi:hypothetical protein
VPHPDLDLDIPPLVTASALSAARHDALASGISWPGIEDTLAATGASPEQAPEIEDVLLDQPAALAVMENRQTPPPDLAGLDHSADFLELAIEMIRFIQHNPGCAQSQSGTGERYTDGFRRFVLRLRRRYADVTTAEFAASIDLPQGTVEDWLRGGRRDVDTTARTTYPRATRGARTRLA